MPKVSVIIPVYNVEKYLGECLDSVLAQTLRDIEIILVDDGSTDGGPAIMREYAQKDSRIRILTRQHSNAGACRNAGIKIAKGEYLSFIDSDDYFAPNMFKALVQGAEQEGADIVCCRYVEFVDGDNIPVMDGCEGIVWTEQTLDGVSRDRPNHVGDVTCDKLYRHAFIRENAFRYLEQPSTNDVTFVWLAVSCARKIVATDRRYIAYRRHRGSTQGKKSRYPECGVRANRAYVEEMRRLKLDESRPWLYKAYLQLCPQDMLSYLATMSTADAYRRAYDEIRKLFVEVRISEVVFAADDYYARRARRMVANGMVEKVQRGLESRLAPLLGTVATSNRIRREFIYCINRSLKLVFDFVPTVRAFPRWLMKRMSRGR